MSTEGEAQFDLGDIHDSDEDCMAAIIEADRTAEDNVVVPDDGNRRFPITTANDLDELIEDATEKKRNPKSYKVCRDSLTRKYSDIVPRYILNICQM